MPLNVEVPGHGTIEFPDGMDPGEISSAIQRNFPDLAPVQQEPTATLSDQSAQAGMGLISGFWSVGESANKVLQVAATRLGTPQIADAFGDAAEVARSKAKEWEQLGTETPGSSFVRHVGAGAASVIPSLAVAPLGFPAMVVTAGLHQFGGTLSDAQEKFEAEGIEKDEALQAAMVPAALDGLQTALITAAFGKTGVEAIKAAATSLGFKSATKEILKQMGFESVEEGSNQLASEIVKRITYDPTVTLEQALSSSLEAAAAGGLVSGGLHTVKQFSGVPFVEETQRALNESGATRFAPIVPRGAVQEASNAPLVAQAVQELPPIIKEVTAPETPKTPETPGMAEDMGAVLVDAHEMAAAKVKSLTGFTDAEGEIMRGKLEDWVREEAEKFQAENGTLDKFLPEKVISTRVNTAIEFVRAQKRGGGAVKVELDKPTEEGGTVGEVIPDTAPAPATASQTSDLAAKVQQAIGQLPTEDQMAARDFLESGRGTLSPGLAGKLRALVEALGITPDDLEPSTGPGAASPSDVGSQKERKFSARFAESGDIESATREKTGNRFYDPRSNADTNWMVNWRIRRNGIDAVYDSIRNNDPDLPGEEKVVGTINITKRLNAQAEAQEAAGKTTEADATRDRIAALIEIVTEREGTLMGRTVQAFRTWSAMGPEGFLRSYVRAVEQGNAEKRRKAAKKGKVPKLVKPSEAVKREILKRAAAIQKLPEGFQKDFATVKLMAYVRNQNGISAGDIAMSWWYASILSSPVTHAINAASAFLNVTTHAFLQAAINPRSTPQIFTRLATGAVKGFAEARAVLAKGDTTGKPGGLKIPATLELLADSPSAFKRLLSIGRYVGRAMTAADMVNYKAAQEMRALLIARETARKEGLRGKALTARVTEILNDSQETQDNAEGQAKAEGLTGNDATRRASEVLEQGRPDELNDEATNYALRTTFNNTPYGVLGVISRHLSRLAGEFPPIRFVMPFINIIGNVTNEGLNYTPWGFKRWYTGAFADGRWFDRDNAPQGNDAKVQAAQALAGSAMMMAAFLMWAKSRDEDDPWFDIAALGPKNKAQRYQWMETGARPYSVKLGDRWYSYQYTPFALGLAIIGNVADGATYNKMEEKDLHTRFAYAFANMGSVVFNQSFLTGLADFLSNLQNKYGTESPQTWARFFARTGTGFVVPQAVKWLDKAFDPEIKSATEMHEFFLREIPIARSTQLKPLLNVLGQPVKKEGIARLGTERFWSDVASDPLWAVLVEKQAYVSVPYKNTKIGKRTMTPDEYYEYVKTSGQAIEQRLRQRVAEIKGLDAERAEKLVDTITREERAKAKDAIRLRAGE